MFWGFQVFLFDSFLNPKLWTAHNNYIALGINLNKENFHCNIRGTSCCSQVMNSFLMELGNSIQIQFIPNVCVIGIPSIGILLGHVTMIFLKQRYFSTEFWNYLLWCYVFDYSTPKMHFVVEHLNYVFCSSWQMEISLSESLWQRFWQRFLFLWHVQKSSAGQVMITCQCIQVAHAWKAKAEDQSFKFCISLCPQLIIRSKLGFLPAWSSNVRVTMLPVLRLFASFPSSPSERVGSL